MEEKATVALDADKAVKVYVEYTNTKPPQGPEADRSQPALMRGVVSKFYPSRNSTKPDFISLPSDLVVARKSIPIKLFKMPSNSPLRLTL